MKASEDKEQWSVDEPAAKVVRQIFHLCISGLGPTQIAKRLKADIWEYPHPAIIDRETFELVQELRQHRHRPTKSDIVSMFSGLLYCEDCGEKLYYSVTNNYKREQA